MTFPGVGMDFFLELYITELIVLMKMPTGFYHIFKMCLVILFTRNTLRNFGYKIII